MDDAAPIALKRPSGSATRRRSGMVNFRASAAERAELERHAERAGLSVSSYIRSRALAAPTTRAVRRPPIEHAALAQMLAQLGKCGSNLNQIARVLNSGGSEPPDLMLAIDDFRAACALIMARLGRCGG